MALLLMRHTSTTCRCLCRQITRRKATMAAEFLSIDDAMTPTIAQLLLGTQQRPAETIVEPELTSVKPYSAIPGPRGLPLAGNAFKYSKLGPYKFSKILDNRFAYLRKYGKIYKERLGTMNIVHIFDPRDLAAMFRNEGKHPSRGTIANLELTYLKRNNLLVGFAFIDGPEWTRQRGVIQRLMMHPLAAAKFLPMQVPVAQDFTTYLRGKINADGIVPDLYSDLFKYTMEAIGVVCFNERLGALSETGDPTRDAGELSMAIQETFFCFRNCMFNFPWYKYFRTPMYRRFEKAATKMRSIMGVHVDRLRERALEHAEEKKAAASAESQGVCPFSAHKTEDNKSIYETLMSDDRVSKDLSANIIMALFRTGIDSTGNAMAFFLYNLANNPEKQQLLYEELQSNLPGKTPLTMEALDNMPYIKACLRESFRLHFPVFGGSGRVLSKDITFSGYNIPKGTFIFANIAAMSRMEEYYPQPLEYHPERWLRDDRADMGTTCKTDGGFLSLPFSHGLRACPGKRFAEQSLYLAVATILQNFRLEYHGETMGMIHMPFTQPDKPLDIKFIPRGD